MAHVIWSGSLSFGLVNIPVNLYSASKPEALGFTLLRKQDLSPINYVRVARTDGKEVAYEDIVKGYEYKKGDYVVLTEEEIQKANVKRSQSIEILDFTSESEIDSIYFEKPYYLEPTKGAAKPYALLVEALKRSKKIGIARFVMRTREHLAVVKPYGNLLVLEQLRFKEEIRPHSQLNIPTAVKADKEINMAIKLINELTAHFNPDDYQDEYRTELLEIIEEKAKKGTVRPRGEELKASDFTDLMEELKKSLKKAKAKK